MVWEHDVKNQRCRGKEVWNDLMFQYTELSTRLFHDKTLTSNPLLGVFVDVGWMYSIVLVFDWYWYNRHPVTLGLEDTCNMRDTWDMYRPVSPDSQVSSHHKPRMLKQYKQVWIIYNHIWLLFCLLNHDHLTFVFV